MPKKFSSIGDMQAEHRNSPAGGNIRKECCNTKPSKAPHFLSLEDSYGSVVCHLVLRKGHSFKWKICNGSVSGLCAFFEVYLIYLLLSVHV